MSRASGAGAYVQSPGTGAAPCLRSSSLIASGSRSGRGVVPPHHPPPTHWVGLKIPRRVWRRCRGSGSKSVDREVVGGLVGPGPLLPYVVQHVVLDRGRKQRVSGRRRTD